MTSISARICVLVLSLVAVACHEAHGVEDHGDGATSPSGRVLINYRGDVVSAERVGDDLIIEGDILVDESDIWSGTRSADGGVAVAIESVKRAGYQYRWPMNGAGIAEIP